MNHIICDRCKIAPIVGRDGRSGEVVEVSDQAIRLTVSASVDLCDVCIGIMVGIGLKRPAPTMRGIS